jgi:hypothetical protein
MNFRKRKADGHDEADAAPDVPPEEPATAGESSSSAVERISTYVISKNDDAAAGGAADVQPERPAWQEPAAVEAGAAADVATIGDEVGAVLKSAREAAGRIRQAADEEARRVRTEAQAAAAAELAEARRVAEDERAEATRLRAEAEANAQDTRAAASQEAEQIVADAATRRDAAEAEAEQKLREATVNEREHVRALQAEIERQEKRLESILAVFRGMTAQLEGLLERRRDETHEDAAVSTQAGESSDELEAALTPGSSGSRMG